MKNLKTARKRRTVSTVQPKITPAIIVVLASLTAVAPLGIDMYLAALPGIAQDLGTTASRAQMTLSAFMLGMAVGQVFIGPLSDKIGRLRPLYMGVIINLCATAFIIFAPTIELVIAARFLAGMGGSFGMVVARAIVADSTRGLQTARLMGIMMMINGFAPVLAPLVGGLVLTFGTWRTIFGVLSIFIFLSTIAVFMVIKETLPAEKRRTGNLFDTYKGLGQVLAIPRYRGFMLTMVFGFGTLFAYVSGSTYVLQNVLGLSETQFTWVFGANSLGIMMMTSLVTYLVGRVPQRTMLTVGVVSLLVVSISILVLFSVGISLIPTLILFFLTTCSVGLLFGNASALALVQARHMAGSASATMGATQSIMGGIASPLVALGGASAYMPMGYTMVAFAILAALAFFTTPVAPGDWTKQGAEEFSRAENL
ncbi:multidrug effflux MFS transporter [Rothia sp. ZJ932]|nr:multidrug effflux MFS transporter [Rothia sp. ZJ932]